MHTYTQPPLLLYHFCQTAVINVTSLHENNNQQPTNSSKTKKITNRLIFIVPFPAKKHYLSLQNNILYIGKCSKLHVLYYNIIIIITFIIIIINIINNNINVKQVNRWLFY